MLRSLSSSYSASRARFSAAIVALALLVPSAGHAQTADPQVIATAQALYEQAAAAMDAKHYADACPKLEEVTRLVPDGLGAKLTLGECYEGLGRLASAWSQLAVAEALAAKAGQTERAQHAAEKAAALKPRLATLSIGVSDVTRALAGLHITRDGVVVGQGQWGTPLPVDAGDHEVIVTAPGYSTWTKRLDGVVDGTSATLLVGELTPLAPEPTSKSPTAPTPAPAPAPSAAPPQELAPQRPWQRPVAATVLGLGGAGVVVGAVLGGLALAKNGDSKQDGRCDANNRCDPTGLQLRDSARSLGTGSTVAIVAGGVVLAAGVVLLATSPSTSHQEHARLELTPGGLLARGTW